MQAAACPPSPKMLRCSASTPSLFAPASPARAEVNRLCKAISLLLEDRNVLKRAVVQCFNTVAKESGQVGPEGLEEVRAVLSRVLQVPLEVFNDIQSDFPYFDFDGNGFLEVNEVYKLVKFHLRQYRKQLGGESATVDMPFKSMEQCGFTVTKELGRGSQGIAKLVHNKSGRQLCVKCLQKPSMSTSGMEELFEEFKTLQNLECDRIAKVFELFQDSTFYYMVAEPYFGGDFMSLVHRATSRKVPLTEQWWRNIFRQCCEGLQFMHEQAMMHCDIKEPNLMLKTDDLNKPQVVIIDFGVCRAMVQQPNGLPGGTPGYMPPETILKQKWWPKGDIFCLGVTLLQVLTGKSPPLGDRTTATPGGIFIEGCRTVQDMFDATLSRQPPFHLVPNVWPGMRNLLQAMLAKDLSTRSTSKQILSHPWFDDGCDTERTPLRSRSAWATIGITKSFLDRECDDDEEVSPAVEAIRKLQRNLAKDAAARAEIEEDTEQSESDNEEG